MKCIICHDDNIQSKDVREEVSIGSDVVFVPVRAQVCQTCGERYYDRRAMRFLEEAERTLREGTAKLRQVGKVLVYS